MRSLLVSAILVVLALLLWWWARGTDPARAAQGKGEGSGEPIAAGPAAVEGPDAPEAAPGAPPVTSAQLTEHTIRVIDEAGAAIAGARVEVRRDERAEATAAAATDGLGRATVLLTRADELFVEARGFMRERVRSPLRLRIAEVVLRRGYDIAGIVVDGAGRGIAGAALRLVEPTLPERTATAGPDGRFAFEDVGEHTMGFRVWMHGYSEHRGTVSPGDNDIRIVLLSSMGTSGVVVFADGSPAAGARVNGRLADADGRFEGQVEPGRLEFRASLEAKGRRWTAESVVEVAADGTHEPIRLVLEPLPRSWINVRVVERDGSPVSRVSVGNSRIGDTFPSTAADGRVALAPYVVAGTRTSVWVVETRTDGLFPGRAEAVTGDRDSPEVVLRPRDPLLVTVVVRGPDGAALPHDAPANVYAPGLTALRRERDATTFAVDPLAPELSFTASAPGFYEEHVRMPPPRDGHVEVRLRGVGTLSCRLVDGAGTAVLGGFVRAWVPRAGSAGTEEPKPDGTYWIQGVPAGRAVVTAGYDDDLPLARAETDVRAGEVTDLGTIVLRSPRALGGRVKDANGRPVGGAHVCAVEGESERRTFSRSDGSFRIVVPPWFNGFVTASKPGYGTAYGRAAATLDLALAQEGKVLLEVRLPPFTGLMRAWSLAARDPATGFQWSRVERERLEGSTYLVSGLPPGRLILVVDTLPKDGETEVVVVAGETVPAVIEVPE